MSIRIPSDLVMDVARAADPTRVAKAAQDLGAGVTPGTSGASGIGDGAGLSPRSFVSTLNSPWTGSGTKIIPTKSPEVKAALELETLLLQQMLEAMMPKGEQSVFGGGTSGAVWRSMMAEHLARNMASSGELDLSRLFSRRTAVTDQEKSG